MRSLQNAMTAAAFAEEGEFDTAREILKAQDNKKKRVLLSINDLEIQPKMLQYAYELSKRVGGQLEVLQILTPSMMGNIFECIHNPIVKTMRDMGVSYKIITGLGSLEEDLFEYAREKRDILLLMLKNISYESKMVNFMKIMGQLNCPVVVYSDVE